MSATHWIPLESNPEVFTKLTRDLTGTDSCEWIDIYTLDEDIADLCALIFLYDVSAEEESASDVPAPGSQEFNNYSDQSIESHIIDKDFPYYMYQTVGNACGTVALVHTLINQSDLIQSQNESVIKRFHQETLSLIWSERAARFEHNSDISNIHNKYASEGQTEAPAADADISLHFVAFVPISGTIWQLDGRNKSGPFKCGSIGGSFMLSAASVIKETLISKSGFSFSLLGLIRKQQ
ncbi:hypothetical protein MIR68_010196 [Amoeboaphelidium protococcarum]|nr:hypothetical protein MIR68_010196 [Amoeboaphelidium protococcarum]